MSLMRPTARPDHGVCVPIWRAADPRSGNSGPDEAEPAFCLMFYDIPRRRFYIVAEDSDRNTGSGIIKAALRRRGLDPDEWWTTLWAI